MGQASQPQRSLCAMDNPRKCRQPEWDCSRAGPPWVNSKEQEGNTCGVPGTLGLLHPSRRSTSRGSRLGGKARRSWRRTAEPSKQQPEVRCGNISAHRCPVGSQSFVHLCLPQKTAVFMVCTIRSLRLRSPTARSRDAVFHTIFRFDRSSGSLWK